MRTILSIDDDILSAAREIAAYERKTIGQVISDLARKTLTERPMQKTRNGIPQILKRPGSRAIVPMELVNALRDDEYWCAK